MQVEFDKADLLFIDTWHVFRQLYRELDTLNHLAGKYIVMHDTTTYGCIEEDQGGHGGKPIEEELYKGLKLSGVGEWPAVHAFLKEHPEWFIRMRATNNNGLTVLQRQK